VLFGGAKEKVSKALEAVPFGDDIDWSSTKAFVGPGSYGVGIYVNTRGRFPNGIVEPGGEEESVKDRILEIVKSLRLPDGAPLAAYASKREDIFWGEMMHLAPDIVCLFAEPGEAFDGARIADGIFLPGPEKRAGTELVWSGTHSLRGIFGLWGNGIARGRVADNASLADVSPTILHLMGLSIAEGLDGKVMREADSEGREPLYVTEEGEACAASKGLTPEQEKDIYEKLKSVGYFH
jgi:predicted AlkP superfamily phosphohydrolase/phosphomutase